MKKSKFSARENAAIKDRAEPKVVTPSAKRKAIAIVTTKHELSGARACKPARLSRATFYNIPAQASDRDAELIAALNGIVAVKLRWGFWKCLDSVIDGIRSDGQCLLKSRPVRGRNRPHSSRSKISASIQL